MAASAVPAQAQDEPKEKPPMYSYVGFWNIPRAQWADMDKNNALDQKILDKALADGSIVGYGSDLNLVHTADGMTHDNWWSGMSGGRSDHADSSTSGTPTSFVLPAPPGTATAYCQPLLQPAARHLQECLYPRGYVQTEVRCSGRTLETLSKGFIVPLLEKLPTVRSSNMKSLPRRSIPRFGTLLDRRHHNQC
jgi:hypothetical protein